MGVEPTICLLAKQMPLPHSSHGPVKMNDDINYTIRNRKKTHLTALIHSATSRIVRVEGFEPSVPPSCLNLGMAQVPTHTTWAFSDEWDVRRVKLCRVCFSGVTCVLPNQTHEWGFISRLATTRRVVDTRSRLRCSLGQMFTPAQPNTFLGLHQRPIRLRPVGL